MKLTIHPLTPARWPDLEAIFNAKGCSIARCCWCMCYRRSGSRPVPPGKTRAQANRSALKELVEGGNPPGLIGYRGKTPVGWVSLGPREEYARLKRSPVMRAVDERPVWSIICFVVPSQHRGQGVAAALLKGAVDYARKRGARLVEAYPVDKPERSKDDYMWFGAKSMYDKAGFKEVARRKAHRPIVRLTLLSLIALGLSGCGTIGTLGESHTRNKVFSGTIRDIQLQCAHGTCLDLPFSFVADTLVLPATIPWSLCNACHEQPNPCEEGTRHDD